MYHLIYGEEEDMSGKVWSTSNDVERIKMIKIMESEDKDVLIKEGIIPRLHVILTDSSNNFGEGSTEIEVYSSILDAKQSISLWGSDDRNEEFITNYIIKLEVNEGHIILRDKIFNKKTLRFKILNDEELVDYLL